MDFKDTPEEATFRADVKEWLGKNAEPKQGVGGFTRRYDNGEDEIQRSKDWQAKKADAGFAAITWPKEYGGLGGTSIQSVIYGQEESKFDVPANIFAIGLGMCIPTVLKHGSEANKERYVKPGLRGEEVWCQLFSEPAGGSDVAALRTRAERKGDKWIVNGQKVWTSGAQYCDYGLLIARTDPDVPKHKGITAFIVDMHHPGVEVRPIKQASGQAGFNEVFFTDVEINDDHRLDEVGNGWKVSLTTLMNERLSIGGGSGGVEIADLIELARGIELEDGSAIQDGGVREKIADWYVQGTGLTYTRFRALTALSKGGIPGPENSIGKVVGAKRMQDMAALALDLLDMGGGAVGGDDAEAIKRFQDIYIGSPGLRIAGGTDEILRNIIAERVLGLPQDIRVDKAVAFKDVPRGK
jgi:alkylation response protein AidB-like acyl-CoA dehydrogenase